MDILLVKVSGYKVIPLVWSIFIGQKASVVMQKLSCPTETVSSNKLTGNRVVLSFKDSPRKPLRRRPRIADLASGICCSGFCRQISYRLVFINAKANHEMRSCLSVVSPGILILPKYTLHRQGRHVGDFSGL